MVNLSSINGQNGEIDLFQFQIDFSYVFFIHILNVLSPSPVPKLRHYSFQTRAFEHRIPFWISFEKHGRLLQRSRPGVVSSPFKRCVWRTRRACLSRTNSRSFTRIEKLVVKKKSRKIAYTIESVVFKLTVSVRNALVFVRKFLNFSQAECLNVRAYSFMTFCTQSGYSQPFSFSFFFFFTTVRHLLNPRHPLGGKKTAFLNLPSFSPNDKIYRRLQTTFRPRLLALLLLLPRFGFFSICYLL